MIYLYNSLGVMPRRCQHHRFAADCREDCEAAEEGLDLPLTFTLIGGNTVFVVLFGFLIFSPSEDISYICVLLVVVLCLRLLLWILVVGLLPVDTCTAPIAVAVLLVILLLASVCICSFFKYLFVMFSCSKTIRGIFNCASTALYV